MKCINWVSGWDVDNSDDKEKRMIPSNVLVYLKKKWLIEAIRSSIDIYSSIPPEEVSRRLNAYHKIIDRCRRQ